MFAALRTAFSKPIHTPENDPLTAATSRAVQENTEASNRLKKVMCKYITGDAPCALKLVHKQ